MANLGVELLQLGFASHDGIGSGSRLALTGLKNLFGAGDELLFPLTDLVGVQLELLGQFGQGAFLF